jgi:Ribonuclease G/E
VTVRILAAASPGEVRVAAVSDDELLDYAIDRPGAPDGVGDLYRGRVTARVPAMAGSFVALDHADGFLPDSEGGKDATEGAILPVRITRAAQAGKGPRLTARLTPPEQLLAAAGERPADAVPPAGAAPPTRPGLLHRGPGAVQRLAALYPDAPVLTDDTALLAALRPVLGPRISLATPVFDDAVAAQVEALAEPDVKLPGGGGLSIHPTPALVAIDCDTGGTAAAGRGKTRHHLAVNHMLVAELARQIRLRNLSGAILVDLAGLPARRRIALGPAIAAALAGDPLQPRFLGFTALGLAEIVRARVHPPLHELLAGPHTAGLTALRAIAAAVAAEPGRMPALRAAPAVARALDQDAVARADLARRTGRALILRADPSLPATAWSLEAA